MFQVAGWIFAGSYFILFTTFALRFLLPSGKTRSPHLSSTGQRISVLIACRNELDSLPDLIDDLALQTYPRALFEVIICDDHSDDDQRLPAGILEKRGIPGRMISLPRERSGKKEALLYAADSASGEIYLFTDADCRVGPFWVEKMVRLFNRKQCDLVIGLVDYVQHPGFSQAFFRQDFLSLIVSGAGSALLGIPVLCNGANMAVLATHYHREALVLNTSSGDDIFILQYLKKQGRKIEVARDRKTIVATKAPGSWKEFMDQRIRWSSKSRYYTDLPALLLGALVLITNILFLISIVMLFQSSKLNFEAGIWMALKIMADCFIAATGLYFFGRAKQAVYLPVLLLLYPFYFLYTFFAALRGKFTWKGRNYTS